MRKRVNRVDANQSEIIRTFQQLGCVVDDVSALGALGYDLVVLHPATGRMWKVEIKNGNKPPSAQALTPNEALQQRLSGSRYVVINSTAAAIRLITTGDERHAR